MTTNLNTLRAGVVAGLCLFALGLSAAEPKSADVIPAVLPNTITLKSGSVLRKVVVIRWEKLAVVVRHAGGADSIRYDYMAPESRAAFEAFRAEGLLAEEKKKQAQAQKNQSEMNDALAQEARKTEIAKAIADRSLLVGMTPDEAVRSWGKPDKINASGSSSGSFDQWIYSRGNKGTTYVYFRNGELMSWQQEQ